MDWCTVLLLLLLLLLWLLPLLLLEFFQRSRAKAPVFCNLYRCSKLYPTTAGILSKTLTLFEVSKLPRQSTVNNHNRAGDAEALAKQATSCCS